MSRKPSENVDADQLCIKVCEIPPQDLEGKGVRRGGGEGVGARLSGDAVHAVDGIEEADHEEQGEYGRRKDSHPHVPCK